MPVTALLDSARINDRRHRLVRLLVPVATFDLLLNSRDPNRRPRATLRTVVD
ncbi:hypothetical protein K523DRAFT_323925, partial [Schizophyllum commune Tattone D]